jgi:NAD(P)-dependent dehydrogenase (short-subunit alcohol dehydrogenase family)
MDLNGISAIVTGGASGLGEATVRTLAQRGAKVVVVDMNPEKGEAVAKDVGGVFAQADVANVEQVIAAVEAAKELGPLRALVTAAGIGWATRTIGRDGQYESAHDLDIFKKVLEVNLVGTFNCVRLAATAMSQTDALADNEKGAIVTVASVAAFDGQIGQVAYSASKAGVHGITLPVARELGRFGIRVCTIAPGIFDTPMMARASDEVRESLHAQVPWPPRFGQPAEYAALVRHIVENEMLNGETIRLDGGIRMAPK